MPPTEEIKRGRCVFCGNPGASREHVFPNWLVELLWENVGHGGWTTTRRSAKWTRPKLEVTVKRVCEPCNNGWMSRLEDLAKPILSPMIIAKGVPIELPTAAQLTVARWAFKTALMADFVSPGEPLFAPSIYTEFFHKRMPPYHCGIWTAGYKGRHARVGVQPRRTKIELKWRNPSGSGVIEAKVEIMTISIFWLVIQVLSYEPDIFMAKKFRELEGVHLIWPPSEASIFWPLDMRTFTDKALDAFASRSGGFMGPLHQPPVIVLPRELV